MNNHIRKMIDKFEEEHNIHLVYNKTELYSAFHKKIEHIHSIERVYKWEMPEDVVSSEKEQHILDALYRKMAKLRLEAEERQAAKLRLN